MIDFAVALSKKDVEMKDLADRMEMWMGECEAGIHGFHPKQEALLELMRQWGFLDAENQPNTRLEIVVKLMEVKRDLISWLSSLNIRSEIH